MAQLVPISRERHADKAWVRPPNYGFARRDAVVPLVGMDIARATHIAPIAFREASGQFEPILLASPIGGDNFFIDAEGRWLGGYVPASLRCYPFRFATLGDPENLVLCIDEDSGLVVDAGGGGEPFFDEAGTVATTFQPIVDFLQAVELNRKATAVAATALAQAGVIGPWELKVRLGEEERAIVGLHMVKEEVLTKLDDASWLALRAAAALPLAYAQLISMVKLDVFDWLARTRPQQAASEAPQGASTMPVGPIDEALIEAALAALSGG